MPHNKTTKKVKYTILQYVILDENIAGMAGRSITISTSKIKKIIVSKKNRSEKGRRCLQFASNPHSKGDDFSRLKYPFLDKIKDKAITTIVIKNTSIQKMTRVIIIFST